jgi:hypothetical protein
MPGIFGNSDSLSANDSIYRPFDAGLYDFDASFSAGNTPQKAIDSTQNYFISDGSPVIFETKIRNTDKNVDYGSLIILILVLFLIVLSKHLFTRRFQQLSQAMGGETSMNLMLREWNPSQSMPGIVFFTYILLFSKFIQLAASHFSPNNLLLNKPEYYVQVLLLTASIIVLRLLLKKIVASLFRAKELNLRYSANEFSYYLIATLVLFAVLLVILFQPTQTTFYISLVAFLILLIYNLIRSFSIGASMAKFSVLYLFLYLCALEIVPFLLLIKSVAMVISGQLKLF